MNAENNKTSGSHRLLLNLPDKIDFKKVINTLLSIYYTWKNKKIKNNKYKISTPTWNEEF